MKKDHWILFLIVFGDMMGFSIIFPLFPDTIRHYLKMGNDPIFNWIYSLAEFLTNENNSPFLIVFFGGILGSIYSLLQFLFSPIWGRLSDRWGRKPVLIFSSLGSLIGYTIWLFSSSFSGFVLSRIITGAMGGNISVASASMADLTSSNERSKGMGMIGAGIGLGFIFGPFLGGSASGLELQDFYPYLQNFQFTVFSLSALVSVLVALLTLILVIFILKESNPKKKSLEVSHSFHHPILDSSSLQFRSVLFVSYIYFLFIFSFSGFEFCLNFFLNEFKGFLPRDIGLTFLYIGMIIIIVQGGIVRRISGKVKEVNIILSGAGILMIGYLGMVFFSFHNIGLFLSLGFLSVGSALIHPGLSSLASLLSKQEDQGKNLGIFRSFGSLARAFSPLTFAMVYFGYGPFLVFWSTLGFTVFLGISLLIWSRK
jgi:MFS family permease